MTSLVAIKPRQELGKYRIVRKVADGGFASVYQAYDTIEGINVALKVPAAHLVTKESLEDFRHEVRVTAKLDHPNILHLKNADFIDGHFVIASPLGERSLFDRMKTRMSLKLALTYTEQMLQALAYAHSKRIIHCDVKPPNFILFEGDRIRLADFGIAKFRLRTIAASGSGTLGYVAPEQAMGHPTFRSDVFSIGLIIYEMFASELPEWPYRWPLDGLDSLRRKVHKDFIGLLQRSIQVDEKKRYDDCQQMLAVFRRIKPRVLARHTRKKRKASRQSGKDWEAARQREFKRRFGRKLQLQFECRKCEGPVGESMLHCPWCGISRLKIKDPTKFPKRCKRCRRGMKQDWRFCAWCYGAAQGPDSNRSFSDKRYVAKCSSCKGQLMARMKYCPWCRTKVAKRWPLDGGKDKCPSCNWGVALGYWYFCPWCSRSLPHE